MTKTKTQAQKNRKNHGKRWLGGLALCVAVLALMVGAVVVFADEGSTPTGNCTTCGGTYTNGFCSSDGTHYQAPEGEGTAEKPYEIANAGNLYWFAEQANAADSTYAGCAVLTADITVNPGTFAADGTYTPQGHGVRQGVEPHLQR